MVCEGREISCLVKIKQRVRKKNRNRGVLIQSYECWNINHTVSFKYQVDVMRLRQQDVMGKIPA